MSSLANARAEFHYHLANVLLRFHWWEAAANAYGRALRIQPDDARLHFQHAWSLMEVPHRRGEAIIAFDTLNRSSPSSFGYYLMACGLKMESRHQEAVYAFEEAARLDPGAHRHSDYSFNYAVSLAALGRLEEAAEAFRNAAGLKPSDGESWGFLGLTLASLGRWTDAVPCLERAMRLAPSVLHGVHLGQTLLWLNRLDEAEQVLRATLVIDSRSTNVKEALAFVLANQDRHEEALRLAQELCAAKPVAVSSQVALASVLRDAGRLDEALREAKAAAEGSPSDPMAQGVLGSVHVDMHSGAAALAAFDQVRTCFDRSTERFPVAAHVWCAAGRGNAFSILARHKEAMSAFEEALRLDPEYFERSPEGRFHYDRSIRESHSGNQRNG